jgi:sulfatase modifying factor 1
VRNRRTPAAILAAVVVGAATGEPAGTRTLQVAIPGTALHLDMVGRLDHAAEVSLWIGRTEVPWELLDAFVFSRDGKSGPAEADAVARPSKPYISMDRGFGHAGYPAICVSSETARRFCDWLSAKTGRRFRLPTVRELRSVCPGGTHGEQAALDALCWHAGNANGSTHPVESGQPDHRGFRGLWGNAAEWAVADDGTLVLWGGSYLDKPEAFGCEHAQRQSPDWNASDPQMPPSRWWLADAPFAGLRVVCEPDSSERRELPPGVRAPDSGTRTPENAP